MGSEPARRRLWLLAAGPNGFFAMVKRKRGGPNPRFWAGEAETPPPPSRLWLFGMYVVMWPRYGYDIRALTEGLNSSLPFNCKRPQGGREARDGWRACWVRALHALAGLAALRSHWVHTRHGRTSGSLPAAAAAGNIRRARVLCSTTLRRP